MPSEHRAIAQECGPRNAQRMFFTHWLFFYRVSRCYWDASLHRFRFHDLNGYDANQKICAQLQNNSSNFFAPPASTNVASTTFQGRPQVANQYLQMNMSIMAEMDSD